MSAKCVVFFLFFLTSLLFSQEEGSSSSVPLHSAPEGLAENLEIVDGSALLGSFFGKKINDPQSGYTIDFTTLSIIEYIRFASKICKVNFIYEESDLNFTITVLSDEPVTAENVMATLIQVLRIHGLLLLEQDNNLVIHKEHGVKQIAKLITEASQAGNAPIVTRIFRLKNASPESVAAIIQPMISSSAMLEVSSETRQLIVTDVTANVDKIAKLIENIDSPQTTLEIKKYVTLHNSPEYLIRIGSQIMNPMTQGAPFILVPQDLSQEIFIVSTPELGNKALEVFANLDIEPKERITSAKKVKPEDVFIYKVVNRSGPDVLKGLNTIARNLKETGPSESDLVEMIESAKWISQTDSIMFVGSKASVAKVREFLDVVDSPSEKTPEKISFFIYKPQRNSAEETREALVEMANNLQQTRGINESLIETIRNSRVNPLTHTISFSGPEMDFPQIKQLLATIDSSSEHPTTPEKFSFFIYKPQYKNAEDVRKALVEMADNLKHTKGINDSIIETIRAAKVNQLTNSISFSGPEIDFPQVKQLLATVDSSSGKPKPTPEKVSFFVYKPRYKNVEDVRKALVEMADNLKGSTGMDESILETIGNSKINPMTHTLSFSGPEVDFPQIKQLLETIDTATGKPTPLTPPSTQFFIYKPKYRSGEELVASLKEVTSQLKSDKLANPGLLRSLSSMKWVAATHSILFTGDPESLQKVETLIGTVDVPGPDALEGKKTFYQYSPKYADQQKTENYLKQVTQNLIKKGGSESLIHTLKSYQWIPESHTFMFYGPPKDLDQLRSLLSVFDTPDLEAKAKPGYYIYKVQHTNGDLIEEDLDNLAKHLKASGIKDSPLLDVIGKMRYVKQTNSLVLSGDLHGIEEAKQLIGQYDYARAGAEGPTTSSFYMYKPLHLPAQQIEKSLKELGTNLKNAGLADPSLLQAIETEKYVESTNTLVFTGTSDALNKIQGMIKEIDIPPTAHSPIQHVGKTTFLLYKLKHAGGAQIVGSIKNMAAELKKSSNADKDFVSALSSIKYVKETNSLLFTGDESSLTKVQSLVEQFDVSNLAGPKPTQKMPEPVGGPSNYFVYKPQSLSGPEIETLLQNFAESLKSSGLVDADLFRTIDSARWSDQTQTLVFTGTTKSIDQIKDLLKEFDIPSNVAHKELNLSPLEPSIQAIDNTSFLVYKLQFHKGDEIQGALRQIAKDLMVNNAPINSGLLNSINSIQWLEVTNSLLCSGDQDTLTRLRELIKNLDIPLKQVYIEMLVLETTLTNALNFGLEWGANYKYRNKFGAASYNSQPVTTTSPLGPFLTNFSGLTPPAEPTPYGKIPPASGFDLGVIGEVIRHNGQTFLTLGSLLTALQTDDESSVIMTPKILTQDGRTSKIFDGRNIPFVGSFVQNNSSNTVNTSNIEYRDIGLNLTVTPVLGNSDIVTLDISLDRTQTVGDANGTINFNSATATGITTSKTTMQTTVHVPDNNFLILSGMVNNSNSKSKAGIPCLGGLPLIGAAFSKNNDTIVNSNIVIFIRPHIINSVDEMRRITKDEEDFFRDQAGTAFLEKCFDEGVELLKTVDDD